MTMLMDRPTHEVPHQSVLARNFEALEAKFERLKRESTIDEIVRIGKDKQTRHGRIREFGFTTVSGFRYAAFVGIPKEQATAVPTIGTSAWFTSVDGHNAIIAKSLMAHGNPVFFVGAEGSYHSGLDCGGTLWGISLAKSAAAVLQFSGIASEFMGKSVEVDGVDRFMIGDSRGAMVGNGISVLASYFDQKISYADLTAACFPRQFSIADIPKIVNFAVREPLAAAGLLSSIAPEVAFEYPSTFDLHPAALAHQLAIAPALFSGEAGDLARLVPRNASMHMTTYRDDFASMHDEWVEIFQNHPNVRVTPLDGSHLSLADPLTRSFILARNQALQRLYVPGEEIDSSAVSEIAHQLVDVEAARAGRFGRHLLRTV